MQSIEVQGKTVEEAIQKALKQLQVRRDEVKIKVLSEEKKGLFGMEGSCPAKIQVTIIKKKRE